MKVISEEKINLRNSKVRQLTNVILCTKLSYIHQSGTFVNAKIYIRLQFYMEFICVKL